MRSSGHTINYFPENKLTILANLVQFKPMLMFCLKDWRAWARGLLASSLSTPMRSMHAKTDLYFDGVVVAGDLDDVAAGQAGSESIVGADELLEVIAVADQLASTAERQRFTPDDRRARSRLRPLVVRAQPLGVRLYAP